MKYATNECPQIRRVRREDRGGALTHIPISPFTAKGLREGVEFIQDGAEDDKTSQAEDADDGYLFAKR